MGVANQPSPAGALLREWRTRQRLTQLGLALDAGISARHLSFIETGRSSPSAEMILLLSDHLGVPFRERNQILLAAGFAPLFPERSLENDPEMAPVREALAVILEGHEPNPAVVVDRSWNLVAANSGMATLAQGVSPQLLEPPVNAMRVGLHPEGMSAAILNFGEVYAHFVGRLERQVAITRDVALGDLLEEILGYPAPPYEPDPARDAAAGDIITPTMRLRLPDDGPELSFFFTVANFGTAVEVTASELSIELGFPADATTAQALQEPLPPR